MDAIASYVACVGCASVMLLVVVIPTLVAGRRRRYRIERW